MVVFVWATAEFEGVHQWEQAPAEVSYLRYPHRHLFKVKVGVSVSSVKDREIEFITLKHRIQSFMSEIKVESCEQIAKQILSYLRKLYPNRQYFVEVSEDGENGVLVKEK